ncbi:hypothetical protein [Pseudokordiimonas caeni]|uniref:hypothetical protein n=1 Tax=Pseudokordiimonas caeni TaxID=2997908 RepID=UPI002810A903|nr:hypothetical protein [Pseudokordiimonas caeni]
MLRASAIAAGLIAASTSAAFADELPCIGSGCDAYVLDATPVYGPSPEKVRARQKVIGGALGGLAGGLIGDEVGGTGGAIAGVALGAMLGMQKPDKERMERQARYYREQYLAGTDISYDPSRPLPAVAHWRGEPRQFPSVVLLPVPLGPDD